MARNVLRMDPSRTTLLRRTFEREMSKRFASLMRDVRELLTIEDALGLATPKPLALNAAQVWRFKTDDQKLVAFNAWLQDRVNSKVLSTDKKPPWTSKYIDSAYKKGAMRAYTDARPNLDATKAGFYEGTQAEFLRSSFMKPERVSKLKLLHTRTYENLKGITSAMAGQMSMVLADGMVHGKSPYDIARTMSKTISGIEKKRAKVLARTEVINAHAEGQLDAFEDLGVDELGIMAEWLTAGDDAVCDLCADLTGVVMSVAEARGLIPRHPSCRCCWIPADKERKEKGQMRGGRAKAALARSVQDEKPKASLRDAKDASTWAGKELVKPPKADSMRMVSKAGEVAALLTEEEARAQWQAADEKKTQLLKTSHPDAGLVQELGRKEKEAYAKYEEAVARDMEAKLSKKEKPLTATQLAERVQQDKIFNEWQASLTPKEQKAYDMFTGTEWDQVRASPQLSASLQSAMDKAPDFKGGVPLYRGLSGVKEGSIEKWKKEGFVTRKFESFSVEKDVALASSGKGSDAIVLKVQGATGKFVQYGGGEMEVMQKQGVAHKVTGVYKEGKVTVVEMVVVTKPAPVTPSGSGTIPTAPGAPTKASTATTGGKTTDVGKLILKKTDLEAQLGKSKSEKRREWIQDQIRRTDTRILKAGGLTTAPPPVAPPKPVPPVAPPPVKDEGKEHLKQLIKEMDVLRDKWERTPMEEGRREVRQEYMDKVAEVAREEGRQRAKEKKEAWSKWNEARPKEWKDLNTFTPLSEVSITLSNQLHTPVFFMDTKGVKATDGLDSYRKRDVIRVANDTGRAHTDLLNRFGHNEIIQKAMIPHKMTSLQIYAQERLTSRNSDFPQGGHAAGFYWDYDRGERLGTSWSNSGLNNPLKVGDSTASIVKGGEILHRHEYGHHVYGVVGGEKPAEGREWRKLYGDIGKSGVMRDVSMYAGTNPSEFFSESFAAWTHPEYKKGMLPSGVETFMQRNFPPNPVGIAKPFVDKPKPKTGGKVEEQDKLILKKTDLEAQLGKSKSEKRREWIQDQIRRVDKRLGGT